MDNASVHVPVMLEESLRGLCLRDGGVYVDATYGGGGHTGELLRRIRDGRVVAFDQDETVTRHQLHDDRLTLVHQNFRHLKRMLHYYNVTVVDGILADLGISSDQLADPGRGFSYRSDGQLDLRMSSNNPQSAADLIESASEESLQQIFSQYGEVRNARTLSRALVRQRQQRAIRTVGDLMQVLRRCVRGNPQRYYAQVFQALRIAVNDELEALKEFLVQCADVLRIGGRLVVISYHSLEDRIVKNFIRSGTWDTSLPGANTEVRRPFRPVNRRVLRPSAAECRANPRARSARMRIAEKVEA